MKGKYRLYTAHQISSPGYKGDYSPLAVALADSPEGPWTKYEGNPLMERGELGDWDDGGISEAEMLFHNGMYHMFYGGTELYGPRLESVGYAYSFDGINYDTSDLLTFDDEVKPGQLSRKTFELDTKVRFIKVLVENLDESESVSNVKITASLGG